MAHEPIVSRLEVNLSWKAWLKPFLIHPSVTDGAAANMKIVRGKKQAQQKATEEQAAEDSLALKVSTLLNGIRMSSIQSVHRGSIETLLQRKDISLVDKVHMAWNIVHKIDDPALKVQLRKLFSPLEIDECTLFIDIDTRIADPNLSSKFGGVFFQGRLDALSSRYVVVSMSDEVLKTDLNALIGAYERKQLEANRSIIAAPRETIERSVVPSVNPSHIFQGSFLKTYGFDGYESSSTELVDAEGNKYRYDVKSSKNTKPASVPFFLALMTFLGFPTRLHKGYANLGPREIVRNLFGGWDSLNTGNSTFQGKRLWNVLLLPIKLVIFAIKIATIPLKFALNVLKLFTEFLPEVILNYSGMVFGWVSIAFPDAHYDDKIPLVAKIFILLIIFAPMLIISGAIHYAARLLALVGTALTSPEKSARSAWNYGRALNSRWGYVFGFIGAAISVALTATLWAVALPLVFAEAVALIPALGPIVASIAQWPIVASTLAYINGAATLVAGTVPAAFSLAATALSSAFGVAVTATTLAVATTVAFVVAPVASITSRILDGLSNLWTKWPSSSPLFIEDSTKEEESVFRIVKDYLESTLSPKSTPTPQAAGYVNLDKINSANANTATLLADGRANPEIEQPYFAQPSQGPAHGIAWKEPVSDTAMAI